jgi:hypothetical protein
MTTLNDLQAKISDPNELMRIIAGRLDALTAADAVVVTPQVHQTPITVTAASGVDGTASNAYPLAGGNTRFAALEGQINALNTKLIAAGVLT